MFSNLIQSIKSFFVGTLAIILFVCFFIFKAALFGMAAAGGWHLYNYFFGKSQTTIENTTDFKKIQDEINKSLPRRLDEITVLNSVNIQNNPHIISYNYSIIKADGSYITIQDQNTKNNMLKIIQSHAKKNFCENPELELLRFSNFTAKYVYRSNGNELFSVQADNSDCHS